MSSPTFIRGGHYQGQIRGIVLLSRIAKKPMIFMTLYFQSGTDNVPNMPRSYFAVSAEKKKNGEFLTKYIYI